MTIKNNNIKAFIWENLQLVAFALTIIGQIIIGANYLLAQSIWLTANIISLIRDFALHRPIADKIKDAGLTALTIGLMIAFSIGFYG